VGLADGELEFGDDDFVQGGWEPLLATVASRNPWTQGGDGGDTHSNCFRSRRRPRVLGAQGPSPPPLSVAGAPLRPTSAYIFSRFVNSLLARHWPTYRGIDWVRRSNSDCASSRSL